MRPLRSMRPARHTRPPRANEYLKSRHSPRSSRSSRSGASTSYFVIEFQRDLAAARSAEVSALASYQKAKTALQRATGTILDDYQIVLDEAFRGAPPQKSSSPYSDR